MKSLKNSFLFFLSVFILFFFKVGFTQESIDSLNYYTKSIDFVQSQSNLSKAYLFFKKDLVLNKKNGNKQAQAYNLYFLSKIDFKMGFYDESEVASVKALLLLDKLDRTEYTNYLRISLLNLLGKVYKEKQLYSEAIKKYNEALVLIEKSEDSLVIYNNISNILKDENKLNEAEQTLLKASKMFFRVRDTMEIARVIDNLGHIKLRLNKENALPYLHKALELRKQSKNSSELYPSYRNLSKYYLSTKDSLQATAYAIKAYNVARLINSLSYKLDASGLRMDSGDYAVANEYFSLSDSLQKAKNQSQNKFALLKYNVVKSEIKTQEEKANRQFYQFIAVLIFSIGLSIFFILNVRHKKQKLQEVYKTETRISKRVHDEVANDMYHVMTKLQSNTDYKEEVLDDLESIYNRTRDISNENSAIELNDTFDNILSDLLLNYKNDTVSIITKDLSKIAWQEVSTIKKTIIYRVLQELMINMKKHSEATIVVIKFGKQNRKITIDYNDNGKGQVLKRGNGLANVENRIQSINGIFTFESEKNEGFTAKIRV
ncbi:ATP-binding protein [Lacinutrix neustonica]|uniref:histidine kinase n=1 Tax=Lacinutrix neustonica TaxID=2980107 RepID=A0A9E8SEM8_9FLAO|nr:tetratricopeptide repeat-containing sensor histidine kinase [Lacinutrix neustonica]WAC03381.1 ATP-binding protein [Lacinutrix neustonica]